MNMSAALDVATKNRNVADGVIGALDDHELGALVLDLLKLLDYAAKQLSSELGWLAIVFQLCRFAESVDWATKSSAEAIVAYSMFAQTADVELRGHGEHELEKVVNSANALDRITDLVFGVIDLWRVLLPALEFELLKHFSEELGD